MISPWSVGRFGDDRGAEAFMRERMVPDVAETSHLNIDYMPVIFPGFSWHNLKGGAINQISRKCGRFYQAQASNALDAGAQMLYSAMFDEVDEGTALFKVLPRRQDLPQGTTLLSLRRRRLRLGKRLLPQNGWTHIGRRSQCRQRKTRHRGANVSLIRCSSGW